jgi:hypothetical protein
MLDTRPLIKEQNNKKIEIPIEIPKVSGSSFLATIHPAIKAKDIEKNKKILILFVFNC